MSTLAALGDETRFKILELLRDGERCVCDINDAVDVQQSLLSFHLKILREAGLVRAVKRGRWVHYSIDTARMSAVEDMVNSFTIVTNVAAECC